MSEIAEVASVVAGRKVAELDKMVLKNDHIWSYNSFVETAS